MTITVTNSMLDAVDDIIERESIGLAPYRAKLLIHLDPLGEGVLEVAFPQNPEGYELGASSRWRARQAQGAKRDVSDFEGHDPHTLSLSGTYVAGDDPERFETAFILPLLSATELILPETLEGPRAMFVAGVHSFTGHIARLRVRRTRTDYRGYATEASVTLEMTHNDRT